MWREKLRDDPDFRETLSVTKAAIQDEYTARRSAGLTSSSSDASDSDADLPVLSREADVFASPWMRQRATIAKLPPDVAALVAPEALAKMTFVDGVIIRFLVARDFRVASVVQRFLNFRELVITHDLSFSLSDEIIKASETGLMHFIEPNSSTKNHAVLVIFPRNLDWNKVTVPQMKRLWLYTVLSVASVSIAACETGTIMENSLQGIGMKNICIEFQKFVATGIQQCVPLRLHHGFIANQPWLFGSVMFPLLKNLLSEKLRKRIEIVGSEYEKVHAFFDNDLRCVLNEMGGQLTLTPADAARHLSLVTVTVE